MAKAVVLCRNIYGEDGRKYGRGDMFDCSQEFIDMVLGGDADAGREVRLTQVDEKRKRRAKSSENK